MDAVVWLLDTIGCKLNKKFVIISLTFLIFFVVALNFIEINVALCFFVICLPMVTERIFFNEIAKNNVIPLKVICGDKLKLIKLFTKKVIYMEIPYVLILTVISVGWNCFHHIGREYTLWTIATIGLLWAGWTQCIFLHFWSMFLNNKMSTWFEMGIVVVVNCILQLIQLLNIVAHIVVFAGVVMLSLVALVGKQIITSGKEK